MTFSVTYLRVYQNTLAVKCLTFLTRCYFLYGHIFNFRLQSYRFYFKLLPQKNFLLPQKSFYSLIFSFYSLK